MNSIRTYLSNNFRRFSGLFWPISAPIIRSNIDNCILPPVIGAKIGSKEPENRLKLFAEIGSTTENKGHKKEQSNSTPHRVSFYFTPQKKIAFGLSLVFLVLFIAIFRIKSPNDEIRKFTSLLPSEDRWFLDYFFRELILREGGAYVLSGSKPAAFNDFFSPSFEEVYFFGIRFFRKDALLKKGFETWKKYESLFPSTNFFLRCRSNKQTGDFHTLLINKKSILNEISYNLNEFRLIFGNSATPESILNTLLEDDLVYEQIFHQNSHLAGIILGFGTHNAKLFHQRELLQNPSLNGKLAFRKQELTEKDLRKVNELLRFPKRERKPLIFCAPPLFLIRSNRPNFQENPTKLSP